jgi:hypothetical protein
MIWVIPDHENHRSRCRPGWRFMAIDLAKNFRFEVTLTDRNHLMTVKNLQETDVKAILKIRTQQSGFWDDFTFYLQDHRLITGIHSDSD